MDSAQLSAGRLSAQQAALQADLNDSQHAQAAAVESLQQLTKQHEALRGDQASLEQQLSSTQEAAKLGREQLGSAKAEAARLFSQLAEARSRAEADGQAASERVAGLVAQVADVEGQAQQVRKLD